MKLVEEGGRVSIFLELHSVKFFAIIFFGGSPLCVSAYFKGHVA